MVNFLVFIAYNYADAENNYAKCVSISFPVTK